MITVTNPGTLAAVDPFGSWGELAGGGGQHGHFPLPRASCVERDLYLHRPGGEGVA